MSIEKIIKYIDNNINKILIVSFIFIGIFMLFLSSANAGNASNTSCYFLEDFGTSAVNGNYHYYEDHLSQPAFHNSGNFIMYYWGETGGNSYWQINESTYSTDDNDYYQSKTQYNYDPTTASANWVTFSGTEPPGTVIETTCPTPTPTPTPTSTPETATTTYEYLDADNFSNIIFRGMILFFILFFFFVFYFKRK